MYEQPLFFFDVTAIAMMLLFAYLSKRLGEAMQIKSYYIAFFITSAAIVIASGLETIPTTLRPEFVSILTNSIRFAAAAIAFTVAMRYWKWLFTEFSKK